MWRNKNTYELLVRVEISINFKAIWAIPTMHIHADPIFLFGGHYPVLEPVALLNILRVSHQGRLYSGRQR